MANTDLPPADDYSYAMSPACSITLNINLNELPKCTKDNCGGNIAPLQWTTHPKSGCNTVICSAWVCLSCGANVMYANGKIVTQPVLMDVNAQM